MCALSLSCLLVSSAFATNLSYECFRTYVYNPQSHAFFSLSAINCMTIALPSFPFYVVHRQSNVHTAFDWIIPMPSIAQYKATFSPCSKIYTKSHQYGACSAACSSVKLLLFAQFVIMCRRGSKRATWHGGPTHTGIRASCGEHEAPTHSSAPTTHPPPPPRHARLLVPFHRNARTHVGSGFSGRNSIHAPAHASMRCWRWRQMTR